MKNRRHKTLIVRLLILTGILAFPAPASLLFAQEEGGSDSTLVKNGRPEPPKTFLSQVYPNPFRFSASIRLDLKKPAQISLVVYDIRGRRAQVVHQGSVPAGRSVFTIRRDRLPTGTYYLVMFMRLPNGILLTERSKLLILN